MTLDSEEPGTTDTVLNPRAHTVEAAHIQVFAVTYGRCTVDMSRFLKYRQETM